MIRLTKLLKIKWTVAAVAVMVVVAGGGARAAGGGARRGRTMAVDV